MLVKILEICTPTFLQSIKVGVSNGYLITERHEGLVPGVGRAQRALIPHVRALKLCCAPASACSESRSDPRSPGGGDASSQLPSSAVALELKFVAPL